ncbi:MAG: hypothetical protein ACTTGZ_05985 [Treponema sp.]
MSDNSLGSYHVSLGMKTDHESFDKAKQSSDKVSNSIARLVGTVRNSSLVIAAGLGAMSIGASKAQVQQEAFAHSLGISAQSIDRIRISARLVGASSSGVLSGLANLDNQIQKMKVQGKRIDEASTSFARLRQEAAKTNKEFEKITHEQFVDMNADERLLTLMQMAEAMDDQRAAAIFIADLLGQTGADFFNRIKMSGKSIDSLMGKASRISTVDDKSAKQAIEFQSELNTTSAITQSLSRDFGLEIAAQLTPTLKSLNDFLYENHDKIQKTLNSISDSIGTIVNFLAPIAKVVLSGAGELTDGVLEMIAGVTERDKDKLKDGAKKSGAAIAKTADNLVNGNTPDDYFSVENTRKREKENLEILENPNSSAGDIFGVFLGITKDFGKEAVAAMAGKSESLNIARAWGSKLNELNTNPRGGILTGFSKESLPLEMYPEDIRKKTIDILNILGAYNPSAGAITRHIKDLAKYYDFHTGKYSYTKIHDGIIRPNGQVTQVAPDDWVFAARNIGDLASAFMPESLIHQHTTNAPQNIVINQTINVTSSTDFLPQTIKEQAHTGAYDALRQIMTESHRRLELMTGIR